MFYILGNNILNLQLVAPGTHNEQYNTFRHYG